MQEQIKHYLPSLFGMVVDCLIRDPQGSLGNCGYKNHYFHPFMREKIHKFRITKVPERNTTYIIIAWCYNLDTSKAYFQGCYVEPEVVKMILRDHAVGSYRSSTLKMKSISKHSENHSSVVCFFQRFYHGLTTRLCHTTLSYNLFLHKPYKFSNNVTINNLPCFP